MNTLENTHAFDGGDFILGESPDNPFARIACKTRKLTPTVCDGTCLGCRKERDIFLSTEPQRLMGRGILKKYTCTTLHYNFATSLLTNLAYIHIIKVILSHTSITTTKVYMHVTNPKFKEAHKKFHKEPNI